MRADWPAHFNVTIGSPRADKLGRNGFEYISDGIVKLTEKGVPGKRLCIALYRESQYAIVKTMVGVSRNKKIRNEIAFHDYLA